jgi:hypothetical protein
VVVDSVAEGVTHVFVGDAVFVGAGGDLHVVKLSCTTRGVNVCCAVWDGGSRRQVMERVESRRGRFECRLLASGNRHQSEGLAGGGSQIPGDTCLARRDPPPSAAVQLRRGCHVVCRVAWRGRGMVVFDALPTVALSTARARLWMCAPGSGVGAVLNASTGGSSRGSICSTRAGGVGWGCPTTRRGG